MKQVSLLLCFFLLCFFSMVLSQTNEIKDPVKKYEEIIDLNKIIPSGAGLIEEEKVVPKDEILLLLPKLEDPLYQGWAILNEPVIWKVGDEPPNFVRLELDLLKDFGTEKILKQSYVKENHGVDLLIYKFRDFPSAYSAYTVLHEGAPTKLKVGKNACESQNLINFWKGSYFIDIRSTVINDSVAKEFIVLAGQDISKNISIDQPPPVVAVQLPALNRVPGSEKYCISTLCCLKVFNLSNFDPTILNLANTGGVIIANYQLSNNPKEKDNEIITLLLTRYLDKESAVLVFNSLKESYEVEKKENKDIDIDLQDETVTVKKQKNDYTMFKQKGNMLALVYGAVNKKSGEKILELVPWPIEITKPIMTNS